ncbi:MAG: ATP-binding protein [Alphaproteobacteria bacterium]|nr:ATP-binding protein [Alphaproteobacteria bacterium]
MAQSSHLSLRLRLFLVGALAVTGALTALLINQAGQLAAATDRFLYQRAVDEAPFFRAALTSLLIERDYASIAAILEESLSSQGITHMVLLDAAGRPIAEAGWAVATDGPLPTSAGAVRTQAGVASYVAPIEIEMAGQRLGRLWVGYAVAPMEALRQTLLHRGLLIGSVALGLTLLVLHVLYGRIVQPLRELHRAAEALRHGAASPPPLPIGTDEFGRLAAAFDAMARQVRQRTSDLEQARDEAEAAARAKADFLAVMSHEIRTPMNGVLGLASVLATTELDPTQRELVALIQRSGDDLMLLLNDVLDFSRLEAHHLALEVQSIDVVEVTGDAVRAMQATAASRGLTLKMECPHGTLVTEGDSARIRQLLLNLIGNAIKFTERGGVRVTLTAEEAGLVWQVIDTGIGIAVEAQASLFQEFVQADASIRRRFGGTGLGLAICRRLVDRMGGTIAVASTPGKGTTFTVRLPRTLAGDSQTTG